MIQSGQEYMTKAWWLIFFPSLMIILTLQSVRGFGNRINSFFNPGLANDK
jgi:ABC-type dipeptide/oligopeptide/nickel transport system permease subunit